MNKHLSALLVLSLLLAAVCFSPALFAQEIRLDVRFGAEINSHESMDGVQNGNIIGTRTFRLSTDLPVPGLRAMFDYGLDTNGPVTRFQSNENGFTRNRFMLGAEWGPTFWKFFRPMVGVTAGYALGHLSLDTANAKYTDWSHDLIGDAYLGAEATLPLGRRDVTKWFGTAGLRFGARGQTAATFDELDADYPDDDPWTRTGPELGTLHPNGWYWDIGIGVARRF